MQNTSICGQCRKPEKGLQGGRCIGCRATHFGNIYQGPPRNTYASQPSQRPNNRQPNNTHSSNSTNQGTIQRDPNAICKFFLDGRCRFGQQCRLTHDNRYLQNQQVPSQPIQQLITYANTQNSPRPADQLSNPPRGRPQNVACKYFTKGYCKNGLRCNFQH